MGTNSGGYPIWTREEDKLFENGIALYGNVDQWENIGVMITGKSIEEVKEHYQILVDDVKAIEAGYVPLPDYVSSSVPEDLGREQRNPKSTADRRRGIPWTEEEHSRFLQGLEKLGRGDWRGIGRHYVLTRTAAQVASHAQKYFQRMQPGNQRRRASIHDVKTEDGGSKAGLIEGESSQFPITIDDMPDNNVEMHDGHNMSPHQVILDPWTCDIGMHEDQNIDFLSTDPTLLENTPNVMERSDVAGDGAPAQGYESGVGVGFESGMSFQQMTFNAESTSLTPVDTIDDSGWLIPSTDVDISFGFSPTTGTSP